MTAPIPGPNVPIKAPSNDQINPPWYTFFQGIKSSIEQFVEQISDQISGFGTAAAEDVGTAAGNVVQLDGDAKLPAVDGSQLTGIIIPGYASDTQAFNAGGTWTKPAGLTGDEIVIVELWAGGGGGSRGNSASVGSGGGGGGYATQLFPASALGATVAVTIGGGGAGATTNATDGVDGGNSTFGAHLTAYGGAKGAGSASSTPGAGGGGGGATSKGSGTQGGGPIFLKDVRVGTGSDVVDYAYGGNGADGVIGLPAGSSIYGGGGGEGSIYDGAGSSIYGGGGGGRSGGTGGGSSVQGGNGGAFGVAGTQPGGGGGGCANGAAGGCIVRIVLIPT